MDSGVRIFLECRKNDVNEKTKVASLIFVSFFINDSTSELRCHKFVHGCDVAAVLGRWERTKGFECATPQIPRCHCLIYYVTAAGGGGMMTSSKYIQVLRQVY